jgi:dolichol-phosphate mannosyltransferase
LLKIITCAYNEAENLKKLIADLIINLNILQRDFEIIFCLDGTTDNSVEVISQFKKDANITILPIENVRGLGNAYKKIFYYIVNNCQKNDLIISLDADNTHNPEQIKDLINYLEINYLDLVIASRFFEKSIISSFPLYRSLISITTSIILQNLFTVRNYKNKKIIDYTSGYRIYRAEIFFELINKYQNQFIIEPEFTYTCELLIKIFRSDFKIDEVPIIYDYDKKIGKSKLNFLKNFQRLIIMIYNLRLKKINKN